MAAPIVVGFLLPAFVFLVASPVRFDAVHYVGFTLLTAFLGVVFVAIAVGFSAATGSHRLALAGAIGVYFLFVPLWGAVQFPLQLYLGIGGTPGWVPLTGQELLRLLRLLNPTGSFKVVSNAFLNDSLFAGESAGLHVAALSMLLAWTLAPPLFGLARFQAADL